MVTPIALECRDYSRQIIETVVLKGFLQTGSWDRPRFDADRLYNVDKEMAETRPLPFNIRETTTLDDINNKYIGRRRYLVEFAGFKTKQAPKIIEDIIHQRDNGMFNFASNNYYGIYDEEICTTDLCELMFARIVDDFENNDAEGFVGIEGWSPEIVKEYVNELKTIIAPKIFDCIAENCTELLYGECFYNFIGHSIDDIRKPMKCYVCGEFVSVHDIEAAMFGDKRRVRTLDYQRIRRLYNNVREGLRIQSRGAIKICPTPDCEGCLGVIESDEKDETCFVCNETYCRTCCLKPHTESCEEYERLRQSSEFSIKFYVNTMSGKVKHCPSCGVYLEKDGGCNHIVCSNCNYHFCWVCGYFALESRQIYVHMGDAHGRYGDLVSGLAATEMPMNALDKSLRAMTNPYECVDQKKEDFIFSIFKIAKKEEASVGRLLMMLHKFGLRDDDPRLLPMMKKIDYYFKNEEEKSAEGSDHKHYILEKKRFLECVRLSMDVVGQVIANDLVIPNWSLFVSKIGQIYEECKEITDGKVATYIPQLARQDPNLWGVSICTVDGQRVSFGDVNTQFCVQSVSKAFNYAIAATDLGADVVHKYVGQEPSGRLFNDICLDSHNKPHNPMVNAGAIVITSLIRNKMNMADRFDYVINQYRKIAGQEFIGFNNATFLSERATADRNYALSYFMKEHNCFPKETESLTDALDFYFQLCSVEVTCESMAVMAATLANGGVCPITNQTCIEPNPCRDVLSLMYSCGMYDASGQFSFSVGLPAKSGVSGVMIVVVPNVMGICLFSPPLDKMGNSCRGVGFCKKLVSIFNFHNYDSLLHQTNNKIDPRRRNVRESDRLVPIFDLARTNDLAGLRRMFYLKEDMNATDHDKRTVLHIAATEGFEPMIKFLVNVAKVNVDVLDRWGRSPLDEARFFNHGKIARFLEKACNRPELYRSESVSSVESIADEVVSRASFTIEETQHQ
ncbi:unnamed protein product [Caenorhabditis bovis]|uniref:glutaminase n=1 Tax=Caenorhabditis bovis TaxID=2654633 RepID=A0A8S1EYI1_9PELO|nr:unnamed protein product [Caenorhabditis bovis]